MMTLSTWTRVFTKRHSGAIACVLRKTICRKGSGRMRLCSRIGEKTRNSRWNKPSPMLSVSPWQTQAPKLGAPTRPNESPKLYWFDDYYVPRSDSGSAGKGSPGRSTCVHLRPGCRGVRRRVQGDEEPGERVSGASSGCPYQRGRNDRQRDR